MASKDSVSFFKPDLRKSVFKDAKSEYVWTASNCVAAQSHLVGPAGCEAQRGHTIRGWALVPCQADVVPPPDPKFCFSWHDLLGSQLPSTSRSEGWRPRRPHWNKLNWEVLVHAAPTGHKNVPAHVEVTESERGGKSAIEMDEDGHVTGSFSFYWLIFTIFYLF